MAKLCLPITFLHSIPLTTFKQGSLSDIALLIYYKYNISNLWANMLVYLPEPTYFVQIPSNFNFHPCGILL